MTNQIDPKKPLADQPTVVREQTALVNFIDELIKEKKENLGKKTEEIARLRNFLLNELNETIDTHLVSILSDQDQKELEKLLDQGASHEEIDQFFEKKIPDIATEIAGVLLNFRAAYLFANQKKQDQEGGSQVKSATQALNQPITDSKTSSVVKETKPTKTQEITGSLPPPAPIN